MLDVAIVGGGVCGLALAHSLHARRLDWALYEARPRLGGRVLTRRTASGVAVDLGPTWFWPANNPSLARLIADLGLATVAQPDDGRVLLLDDAGQSPRVLPFHAPTGTLAEGMVPEAGAVHGGAQRLVDGMTALVDAFSATLPAARIHLAQPLVRLVDAGDHVVLHFNTGTPVQARRVVLALPPRLVAEQVSFAPALSPELFGALQATTTWMASAAKAVVGCERAIWRERGEAGNAWVTHAQAMLAESFEVGDAERPALGGFVALGVDARQPFRTAMPVLLQSQVNMLYGPNVGPGEVHLQDWADEGFTCSELDRREDGGAHPQYGDDQLQQGHWQGRLWFGGSETSRRGGGYVEGALNAAGRLRRQLTEPSPDQQAEAALKSFAQWVQGERGSALQRYRARMTDALSQQQSEQLTQRAVLGAIESLYQDALSTLQTLPLPPVAWPVEQGRHALTPQVLAPFMGFADELLAEAMRFNAESCALRNFPFEHKLSGDYVNTIRRDLAAAWQAFAFDANRQLCTRHAAA